MQAWINDVKYIVNYFKANYKVPYKESIYKRKTSLFLTPFLCGFCCCWSILTRIICCPLSCNSENGLYGQNIFSEKSDNIIKNFFDKNNKRITVETMPSIKDATIVELNQLISLFNELIILYKVPFYTREHYILTDCVIKSICKQTDISIPEFAKKILYNNLLRVRLELSSRSFIIVRKSIDIGSLRTESEIVNTKNARRRSALDPPIILSPNKKSPRRSNTFSQINYKEKTTHPKRTHTFSNIDININADIIDANADINTDINVDVNTDANACVNTDIEKN